MSNPNNDSEEEQNDVSRPSITFDMFKTFFDTNSDMDNAEYYQAFPSVNPGTIRSWKARAKTQTSNPSPSPPSTPTDQPSGMDKMMDESIEILKKSVNIHPQLLEGLDKKSQYQVLKNAFEQKRPDPNIRLMTPSGAGSQKLGIEEYVRIDERSFKERGFGDINVSIPASKLFNPKESKKLGEYL